MLWRTVDFVSKSLSVSSLIAFFRVGLPPFSDIDYGAGLLLSSAAFTVTSIYAAGLLFMFLLTCAGPDMVLVD